MSKVRRRLSFLAFTFLFVPVLTQAQTPLRLVPVTPCRLIDTRDTGGAIQGGTFRTFDLPQLAQTAGCASLSSAAAYSLNVTVVPSGRLGYLTIWPAGQNQPVVSLMNSLDGRIKANAAIVPAGTSGGVSVYVSSTTNVILDIDGYFDSASDSSALAFYPLTPCRVVDTRMGNGGPLQAGVERDFPIPGSCDIPSNAQAYSFNFTVVPINNGRVGYLSVWPAGQSQPVVSTLNDPTGTIVANAAIVPAGSQSSTAVFANNSTNLLIDVNGYFAPASSAPNPLSLYPLTPCRVLDTRNTTGLFNGTLPVAVVGSACGISSTASGFVFNSTVVPPASLGYLTLWPQGEDRPTVSTLNATDGAITSNMAIVPTLNGSVNSYASANTQLLMDISSYFAPISSVNILTSVLPDGTLNDSYSAQLVAAGGVAPYTWATTGGSLPTGVSLDSNGLLHGSTTAIGNFDFNVQVTDSDLPASAEVKALTIAVNGSGQTLGVTTTSLPSASVNTPYNALLTANGGVTPYTWSISAGSLPAGLTLDPSTGQLSGLASASGLGVFTVKVTDSQSHTATQPLSITVNTNSSNGVLNGSYAFSFAGYVDGFPFVWAGSFVADGGGNITSGIYDLNCTCGLSSGAQITGTYSIAADGMGSITLNGGSYHLLVAVGSAEDMRIIAMNQNGSQGTWGSGVIRQQNPADFNFAALAGNWALGAQGFDPNNPEAAVGSYHQDSQGNVTNGSADRNDFGTVNHYTFNGGPTGGIDANGRVIQQFDNGGGTVTKSAAYIISANELLSVGIDAQGALITGGALRQSSDLNNGSLNGVGVFRGSRQAGAMGNPHSDAQVGTFNTDGAGNITLTEDDNNGGSVTQQLTGTGTYAVSPNGRTPIGLGQSSVTCYVIGLNQGWCVNSSGGASVIYFEPQAAGPFSDASWSGEFLGGTLPAYVPGIFGQLDSISTDGGGNLAATYTQSGSNGTVLNQTLSATYAIDHAGHITISQNGNLIYLGYVVGPNKVEVISTDGNPRTSIEQHSSAPGHR